MTRHYTNVRSVVIVKESRVAHPLTEEKEFSGKKEGFLVTTIMDYNVVQRGGDTVVMICRLYYAYNIIKLRETKTYFLLSNYSH